VSSSRAKQSKGSKQATDRFACYKAKPVSPNHFRTNSVSQKKGRPSSHSQTSNYVPVRAARTSEFLPDLRREGRVQFKSQNKPTQAHRESLSQFEPLRYSEVQSQNLIDPTHIQPRILAQPFQASPARSSYYSVRTKSQPSGAFFGEGLERGSSEHRRGSSGYSHGSPLRTKRS
jgi:hypothetical protein